MIVEDAEHPFLFRDIPVSKPASPASDVSRGSASPLPFDGPLRRPAGPTARSDSGWGAASRASLCRTGRRKGLATGTEIIDGPVGGFHPGKGYVLRSPGSEALVAAQRLLDAARSVGIPGMLVDPETMLRNAVPEVGESDWAVQRPGTLAALRNVRPDWSGPGAAAHQRILVIAAPQRLLAGADKRAAAGFVRWAKENLQAAAASGTTVVFVLPWTGEMMPRPLQVLLREADSAVHFERLVDGGLMARNLQDGRVRIQDASGRADRRRERNASGPMVPWFRPTAA